MLPYVNEYKKLIGLGVATNYRGKVVKAVITGIKMTFTGKSPTENYSEITEVVLKFDNFIFTRSPMQCFRNKKECAMFEFYNKLHELETERAGTLEYVLKYGKTKEFEFNYIKEYNEKCKAIMELFIEYGKLKWFDIEQFQIFREFPGMFENPVMNANHRKQRGRTAPNRALNKKR